jgi:hypothetical protein
VTLYDVVERKYAGFSQVINDCFYGCGFDHPYDFQVKAGTMSKERESTRLGWMGKRSCFDLPEWLYVFILHRVTGSGIHYGKQPSGYHNTILTDEEFAGADSIEEMAVRVNTYPDPFYTSVGYQFPRFPKPPEGYKRAGDWFLTSYAPRLARDLAELLTNDPEPLTIREIGDFMFKWNNENGLVQYRFQYAAVIADIADWFPDLVQRDSLFYYGTNAKECISYLAKKPYGTKTEDFLDQVMLKIYKDTGSVPYNAEDVCCDFIRYVENYVKPGHAYDHLDLDNLWNSSSINDHAFGRQKAMVDLGLVKSFKGIGVHPSDDYVLSRLGISVIEYQLMVMGNKKHEGEPLSFSDEGPLAAFT